MGASASGWYRPQSIPTVDRVKLIFWVVCKECTEEPNVNFKTRLDRATWLSEHILIRGHLDWRSWEAEEDGRQDPA